ncbi:MAG: EAL domain-containing protein [Alphaproteobacteria bacterium]|nr:EAL domain-containing protein [Alphaproteobacteria bacterium]
MVMKRILIADDDEALCSEMAEILHRAGYHCIWTSSAVELIVRAQNWADLLILDLAMPEADGMAVIEALRCHGVRSRLILMSGYDDAILRIAADAARSAGLHLVAVLKKPVAARALEETVRRGLDSLPADENRALPDEFLTQEHVQVALSRRELSVHLQPKVSLIDGTYQGAEALLRWKSPTLGLVNPSSFIRVAERSFLINTLTNFACSRAFSAARQLRDRGVHGTISVNFSAKSLIDGALPERLEALIKINGLSPSDVILEITETARIERQSASLRTLVRCRLKGMGISIDDFGMGMNNLELLEDMPLTEIKIDRAMIAAIGKESRARAIVDSIIRLASDLKVAVVAEGIKTVDQARMLLDMGCCIGQGHLFASAMPPMDMVAWALAQGRSHITLRPPCGDLTVRQSAG